MFKALPLQKWVPTDADMQIVRTFLLRHSVSSCQHHLARSVLAGLNWGLSGSVSACYVFYYYTSTVCCVMDWLFVTSGQEHLNLDAN